MGLGNQYNQEWLNQNAIRSYPISELVSREDTTSTFIIPNSFIIDLIITVHEAFDLDPGLFHIYGISVFTTGYVITIGYNNTPIASVSVIKSSHTFGKSYFFYGDGDFSDTVGRINIGALDDIDSLPAGIYVFDVEESKLVTTTIKPDLRGVTSIAVRNGTEVSDKLTGDVVLVAGENIRFVIDESDNSIRIDAIEGEGLIDNCDCEQSTANGPIYTINGVAADEFGNISLIGDDCVEIISETNALRIKDSCSKPCCGCAELEVLTQALQALEARLEALEDFADGLDEIYDQFTNVLLTSTLNEGTECS